jgi:hypothetical protein
VQTSGCKLTKVPATAKAADHNTAIAVLLTIATMTAIDTLVTEHHTVSWHDQNQHEHCRSRKLLAPSI